MMKSDFDSFHGTILRSDSIAGLTLAETSYAPNLTLAKHSHRSPYFCYVLNGGFTEVYGAHSRVCDSAVLIYHPAGEPHSEAFHTESRCFNLKISQQWNDRMREVKTKLSEPADFRGGVVSQLVAKLYGEFRNQDDLSSLVIEGLMLEIFVETARRPKNGFHDPPRWLGRARQILHDRFREKLSLKNVAHDVGVHETHLAREFRRQYGSTIGEFVRQLRIEFACQRLSLSASSVAEIAMAAGFFDQSHFVRTFKSRMGMTPHEYRRYLHSR